MMCTTIQIHFQNRSATTGGFYFSAAMSVNARGSPLGSRPQFRGQVRSKFVIHRSVSGLEAI